MPQLKLRQELPTVDMCHEAEVNRQALGWSVLEIWRGPMHLPRVHSCGSLLISQSPITLRSALDPEKRSTQLSLFQVVP